MVVGGWGQDCGAVQATHLKPVPQILDPRPNRRLNRTNEPNLKRKSPKVRPTSILKSLRHLETNSRPSIVDERVAVVLDLAIVGQGPSISDLTPGTRTVS